MGHAMPRLVKNYERLAHTLAGFHVVAFVGYMLKQLVTDGPKCLNHLPRDLQV